MTTRAEFPHISWRALIEYKRGDGSHVLQLPVANVTDE